MSCKPSAGTRPGTLHTLRDRVSGKQETFEWTGKSWSAPGTGWGTKWSLMDALGWRYVGPVTAGVPEVFMTMLPQDKAALNEAYENATRGAPADVKTGWPAPELMQDDDRGLSRALADPLGESLRRKPVSIKAMPAGVQASEPLVPECETCRGVGTIDERLGGYSFSNPAATCPDCDGTGEGPAGVALPDGGEQ